MSQKFFEKKNNDNLLVFIKNFNPDIIIISQGNNIASLDYLKLLLNNNFIYCTITHLVAEVHWLYLNNESFLELRTVYEKSLKNFFVSEAVMKLHYQMLCQTFNNSEIIYNPWNEDSEQLEYPTVQNGYKIAFVGRLECFHKGLDILLKVISEKKWQNRDISINIYGDGPHLNWIKQTIISLKITNVYLKGFTANIKDIWKDNHILILPSRMEGQSLSLIEALMFNRTAIVTNVGGAAEIIENNVTGFIADYPDVLFLDKTLEIAWSKRSNWEQMGKDGKEKITKIFPQDVIEYFNNKIKELL